MAYLRQHLKAFRILGLFGLVFALAACDPSAFPGGSGQTINTRDPVPVALLVPRGSGDPNDETLARSLENAARLAMAGLGEVEVDLRVYSTAANAEMAASVATVAVNEGAKIILGPVYAEAANAAGLAVRSRNVNVLSFSNNTEIAGANVFVLGLTFQNIADRLTRFAGRNGVGNMMVVHANTLSGQTGRAAITSAAGRAGVNIAAVETYEFSQDGVVSAVPRIAGSLKASGANALFLTSERSGALPLFAQLLPENGVDPAETKFIGLTRWDRPADMLALPGLQGGWFAVPDPGPSAGFEQRYQATYGEPPHLIAGLAFDGIAAVGALVGSGNSAALTTGALTQPTGFLGANGAFRLLPGGTNERALAVAEVRDSQSVVIDPAPRSFGGTGF